VAFELLLSFTNNNRSRHRRDHVDDEVCAASFVCGKIRCYGVQYSNFNPINGKSTVVDRGPSVDEKGTEQRLQDLRADGRGAVFPNAVVALIHSK